MKKIKLPDQSQCFFLLKKYHFPKKKLSHVKLVAKLALFLAEKLERKGFKINRRLIEAAALLHDVDKGEKISNFKFPALPARFACLAEPRRTESRRAGRQISNFKKKHPFLGTEILKKEGYPEVAKIVLKHDLSAFLDKKRIPKKWEEKIVALSDKMVKNKIMTVDERFKLWFQEKLPKKEQEILHKSYPKLKALEKEIFEMLKSPPEKIIKIGL